LFSGGCKIKIISYLPAMDRTLVALVCLACVGHAQRVRRTDDRKLSPTSGKPSTSGQDGAASHSLKLREALLLHAGADAAFSSSIPRAHLVRNRFGGCARGVMMGASTAPALEDTDEEWKLGKMDDGSKFLWRSTDDPENPEIKLLPDDWDGDDGKPRYSAMREELDEKDIDGLEWKFCLLDDGSKFLWRDTDDRADPDVHILSDDWEVGHNADGDKYLWRKTDDPDEREVKHVSFPEIYPEDDEKQPISEKMQELRKTGLASLFPQ